MAFGQIPPPNVGSIDQVFENPGGQFGRPTSPLGLHLLDVGMVHAGSSRWEACPIAGAPTLFGLDLLIFLAAQSRRQLDVARGRDPTEIDPQLIIDDGRFKRRDFVSKLIGPLLR